MPDVGEDEKPFDLPEGWKYCRFGNLINSIISGGTPSKNNPDYWNGKIPWASVKDLGKSKYLSETQDYITLEGLNSGGKLTDINDVIICTRMGLGKIGIAEVQLAINQDLKAVKLTSQLDVDYFFIFFATLNIKGTGTTVAGIKQDELLNFLVPLPPLPEQHRIVTKVDELMALCDQLEQQQNESNLAHQKLVEALLGTLTSVGNQKDFEEAWQRIANHFDLLFTTEQSVDQLKQACYHLATTARRLWASLVPQDPNDEPASELLKKIAKEKAKLVKEGKIKKQKPLPEIEENEKLFEIPENSKWVRLQTIVYLLGDGLHGTPTYTQGTKYYFINGNNLNNGKIEIKPDTKTVSAEEMLKYKKNLDSNTVLVSINGTLGNTAFYNGEEIMLGKSACYFNLSEKVLKSYIKVLIESPYFRDYALKNATGTTIKNLGLKAMNEFPIPLPSLAEQHRIVAKVDELFAITDALKEYIIGSQETRVKLADALIENAIV